MNDYNGLDEGFALFARSTTGVDAMLEKMNVTLRELDAIVAAVNARTRCPLQYPDENGLIAKRNYTRGE